MAGISCVFRSKAKGQHVMHHRYLF